jgi:hypothetical protein
MVGSECLNVLVDFVAWASRDGLTIICKQFKFTGSLKIFLNIYNLVKLVFICTYLLCSYFDGFLGKSGTSDEGYLFLMDPTVYASHTVLT